MNNGVQGTPMKTDRQVSKERSEDVPGNTRWYPIDL